jgi:hypothetical protein
VTPTTYVMNGDVNEDFPKCIVGRLILEYVGSVDRKNKDTFFTTVETGG